MRVKDILMVASGMVLGAWLLFAFGAESPHTEVMPCFSVEEDKLRVTLMECSQAAMDCMWGEHENQP